MRQIMTPVPRPWNWRLRFELATLVSRHCHCRSLRVQWSAGKHRIRKAGTINGHGNSAQGPRDMISGLAMAARTADKARVVASGVVGKVDYNCSMDRQLFAFIGADATEYLSAVTSSADDSGVARFVSDRVASKSDAAISEYNDILLGDAPTEGTEEVGWFLEAREKRGRGRTDIFTWPDLIDVEEGRDVPLRADTPEWARPKG